MSRPSAAALSAILLLALAPGLAGAPAPPPEIRIVLPVLPGTPFAEGDVLVARRRGEVEWRRAGRLLSTVADPAGLVAAGAGAALAGRLVLLDAGGREVHDLAAAAGGPLFLAAGPPAHVFYRRGHRFDPRTVLLTYHGGYVMGASRTQAIFWGSEWADAAFAGDTIDGVDSFLAGFGGSPYAGILKEYATVKARATSVSTYLGHVFDATPPPGHNLSAQETIDEACRIAGDHPDPGTVYLVYTSTGLDPVDFCAYHTWWTCAGGAPIQAAYLPNLGRVHACQIQDTETAHSAGLTAIANATAHELSETITDPRGEGWFDAQKDFAGEVADKCAYVFGRLPVKLADGSQWKIQTEWSNVRYLAGKGELNHSRQAGCVQR